jgi:hypothetical protein
MSRMVTGMAAGDLATVSRHSAVAAMALPVVAMALPVVGAARTRSGRRRPAVRCRRFLPADMPVAGMAAAGGARTIRIV